MGSMVWKILGTGSAILAGIAATKVADGPIDELLCDGDLLSAHRLELPWGFVVPRRW